MFGFETDDVSHVLSEKIGGARAAHMATSSSAGPQDVLKLWVSIPTRALMKRYQRAQDCDKTTASAVCTAYKHFLTLKILGHDFDDTLLTPPPRVHAMWREHVLDTAAYANHCQTLCGRILHHAPDADADDESKRVRRCHRTLAAYTKHFGDEAPAAIWDYGELPPLSRDEQRKLAEEAPAPKRAKSSAAQMSVSMQAPFLPLRTVTAREDMSVAQLFKAFVDASGATHLVPGRAATPPTTRLRSGNEWLHDLQQLGASGVKDGCLLYIAVPQERHSRDQCAVGVKDVASGESATVFARPTDSVEQLMRYAQDALGVDARAQQLIFRGAVLDKLDTLASRNIVEGATVQMVAGRRQQKEAQMSPGGTWR